MRQVGQTVPSRCFILQLSPFSSWHFLENKEPTTSETNQESFPTILGDTPAPSWLGLQTCALWVREL